MCMWQEGASHVCACGRKELATCVHVAGGASHVCACGRKELAICLHVAGRS